jgi:CheY-like chemotaxis protein
MAGYGLTQAGAARARGSFSPCQAPAENGERSAGAAAPIEVLLVEDSPADVRFFREALHLAGVRHHLSIVTNGEEALAFLRKEVPYRGTPRPEVIVLDLKLPRVSGHAVLGAIKLDPDLRSIPIVVLTSSHAARDQERSYDLDADHYVTKPIGLDVLAGELRIIEALAGRRRP